RLLAGRRSRATKGFGRPKIFRAASRGPRPIIGAKFSRHPRILCVLRIVLEPDPRTEDVMQDGRLNASANTKRWVLALTAIASFMVALDAVVVSTALSTIRLELNAPIEALEWVVNAYNLSFAVLLLTGAALGDRLGRRRMFVAGLALFIV